MTLSSWLKNPSHESGRAAERRNVPGLIVYHITNSRQRQDEIGNISSTGVYVQTRERWFPGSLVSLTLQRLGPPERNPERRATLQARVVWRGDEGIGLEFVLPKGLDFNLWENDLNSIRDEAGPEDVVREFRTLQALAFLVRLCPGSTSRLGELFHQELGIARAANASEIALKAEASLMFNSPEPRFFVHTEVMERIIDDGSWAEDDRVRQFWAGLLLSSRSNLGRDKLNLDLIDTLREITPSQIRILNEASTRATVTEADDGTVSAQRLLLPMDQVFQLTGTLDLSKVDRDLAYLYSYGLLEGAVNSLALLPSDVASLTPTSLGLELYARCNGHRGALSEFYHVSAAAPAAAPEA